MMNWAIGSWNIVSHARMVAVAPASVLEFLSAKIASDAQLGDTNIPKLSSTSDDGYTLKLGVACALLRWSAEALVRPRPRRRDTTMNWVIG
jgi:hypothetical protein